MPDEGDALSQRGRPTSLNATAGLTQKDNCSLGARNNAVLPHWELQERWKGRIENQKNSKAGL